MLTKGTRSICLRLLPVLNMPPTVDGLAAVLSHGLLCIIELNPPGAEHITFNRVAALHTHVHVKPIVCSGTLICGNCICARVCVVSVLHLGVRRTHMMQLECVHE